MKNSCALAGGCVALLLSACAHNSPRTLSVVGVWTAVHDEDGTQADIMEFRSDGKYVNRGFDCSVETVLPFHIHEGDIYVTSEVPNKGPIALIFRPSKDNQQLTYTSPRTRNNAVYKRLERDPCKKAANNSLKSDAAKPRTLG